MEWSRISATNAYLDALKLCGRCKKDWNSCETHKPATNEFISALAAGMSAKLIVEITSDVSPSTVALAAAARQTGGKFVCILPEPNLHKSQKAIEDSGLNNMVEFKTGDPVEVLHGYENIDFSLVDCKADNYDRLLEKLDVNPERAVVVANNLLEGGKGFSGHLKGVENRSRVKSMKHPIGKGMEITMIGMCSDLGKREKSKSAGFCMKRSAERRGVRKNVKSKWVVEVDEKSGEEHIFRMPKSNSDYWAGR